MKTLIHIGLGLVFLCSVTLANAQFTMGDYPGNTDPCLADRQASFEDGRIAGDAAGYARGLGEGTTTGTAQGIAQCFADPQSCNITLASCLPDPVYGETEPNDNMIAADALVLDANFWGQSYGVEDQDWFYTETTLANQNLLLNFKVPGGALSGWKITVRDAAGTVFANFDTAITGSVPTTTTDEAMTYRVTLGLVGTYYIAVQPTPGTQNFSPYYLSALLQDSGLETAQPLVGMADAEIEPNNIPSQSNPLATGVTMYGLINLTFNEVVPGTGTSSSYTWAQGENDWFVYNSPGNEIITLTFCAKEVCGTGDWFVEIYDQITAQQLEAGQVDQTLQPLLAINTTNSVSTSVDSSSKTYRVGLNKAGYYLMRVNHKQLLSAPCVGYYTDLNNDGLADTDGQACGCSDGGYSCKQDSLNPGAPIMVETIQYPLCLDGSGGGDSPQCSIGCVCQIDATSGASSCRTDKDNNGLADADGQECGCDGETTCKISILNSGATIATQKPQYPLCRDGSGGGDEAKCSIGCVCTNFGGVVQIPEGAITSPYNFTWFSTQLPPNTYDTEAYQEFLNRSNPYQQ
ncbi:hypothetical protein CKO12_06990 [Chromatium okenii]|uniref:hypothetical protein n=1 Tax=Chromatium okenii TaxID=61644 RepID=UPI001904D958|nr:hypothetical protein [Chromatium okenii]MBK1641623.1 hypothetical protein [Chromatium okenii]